MAEPNQDRNGKAPKPEEAKTGQPQPQQQQTAKPTEAKGEDAITLLKNDHRRVEQLFEAFEKAVRRSQKQTIAKQICQELIIHTQLEEEIFYPACRDHLEDRSLDEAQVEHDGAKILINELLSGSPEQPYYDAKVKVLSEMIKHHVNEEEQRNEGIFAKAKAAGIDTDEIAQRLTARKSELLQEAEKNGPERPRPRSFAGTMESAMPYERDDRSRYGRNEDDDRNRRRGRMPERDESGRFMSDDDDDDDRGRGNRGRGGWFGDPEGHSMAARSGRSRSQNDDDRGSSSRQQSGRMPERDDRGRFMSDDDDDRRSGSRNRSMRGRDDDDDRGGDGRGWFGDPQGHAEASRRGWDNRDDGRGRSQGARSGGGGRSRDDDDDRSGDGRGWFGDPEGHAEASRRGWENRSDDGRSSGRSSQSARGGNDRRSRDDDDDDRRGGGRRSQGGWFGDPRGHSEASRRGWENRDRD